MKRFLFLLFVLLSSLAGSAQDHSVQPGLIDRGTSTGQIASWDNVKMRWTASVEVDPAFTASVAANITDTDTANWDEAFSWGNWAGHTQDWSTVTGVPGTYTPTAHTQDWSTITGTPGTYTPTAHTQDWSTITNPPSTYAPSAHIQDWTTITGVPGTYTPTTDFTVSDATIDSLNSISVTVTGNLEIGSTSYFYLGPSGTDGSWRFYISGTAMIFERRISSSWVEKGRFEN